VQPGVANFKNTTLSAHQQTEGRPKGKQQPSSLSNSSTGCKDPPIRSGFVELI